MGIYDREYIRHESSHSIWGGRSAVTNLIIINVLVYLIDYFTLTKVLVFGRLMAIGGLTRYFALFPDLLTHPWHFYQLLTAGFLHDTGAIFHIAGNMYCLWLFGREVEGVYGAKRFVQIYLSLIIASNFCWVLGQVFWRADGLFAVGASGGIMGIMVLYACLFPRRTFLFYMVIPVPAWLLVVGYVFLDFSGTLGGDARDNVAHTAHLAGAAFGFFYYKTRWCLADVVPWKLVKRLKSLNGPKLRVHDDSAAGPSLDDPHWQEKVDAALEKIAREGEASLTPDERRLLEEASRRFQQRRK